MKYVKSPFTHMRISDCSSPPDHFVVQRIFFAGAPPSLTDSVLSTVIVESVAICFMYTLYQSLRFMPEAPGVMVMYCWVSPFGSSNVSLYFFPAAAVVSQFPDAVQRSGIWSENINSSLV